MPTSSMLCSSSRCRVCSSTDLEQRFGLFSLLSEYEGSLVLWILVDLAVIDFSKFQQLLVLEQGCKLRTLTRDEYLDVVFGTDWTFLLESKYITGLLQQTKMDGSRPISTPIIEDGFTAPLSSSSMADPQNYRSIVSVLQYVTIIRPDIAFVVNHVCQFMHAPIEHHWESIKRIIRYLKDWVGSPEDRRSTSGYAVFLGRYLIS
ncbi:uncharacterized mitochondrial protein AtMg00810-like [Zingiber officinale]|uniref:uncharacterized mitochondrial protein AtMg00810-like n=1 Tax=Zingiber officinale TaxID=94328 RepID=UPI001C4C6551|nr:uncharacterized mitochondrial protein AtMg00810-like [Zingiber officinale]